MHTRKLGFENKVLYPQGPLYIIPPGVRALFYGLACAYGYDDNGYAFSDVEEAQRQAFEIETKLIYQWKEKEAPKVTLDTGNTHQLWHMTFGAYGDHSVFVWGDSDICDALEAAAEVLPKGMFTEPEWKEALAELFPGVEDIDDLTDEQKDEVRTHAEEDLTDTECGYLASYEWSGSEVSMDDALEWMYEHG
jgi:hypothetical protein